jgi:hypothetical protein
MQPAENTVATPTPFRDETKVTTTSVSLFPAADDPRMQPPKRSFDKRFLWMAIITTIGFASLAFAILYVGSIGPLIFAGSTIKASDTKSMVFAYPLTITQNTGTSTIQVFLVAEDGKPIPNKEVTLNSSLGQASPESVTTDQTGTATFSFTSGVTGIAELSPVVDSKRIPQIVTVKVQ